MANLVYTDSQHYQDIATAIRNKNGTNNTYTPAQMAAAINALDGSGGSSAISVVDTTDAAGGTIRTITAVDISDTTAVASDVASGKYFYTADGTKTAGTASVGGFDCPVFDMVIDNYGNVTSLSCNKTYQQCLRLLTAFNVNSVAVFKNSYSHAPDSYTYAPSSVYDDYYQGQRVLYYYNFGMSDHSVMYKSDGSLVVVDGDSL